MPSNKRDLVDHVSGLKVGAIDLRELTTFGAVEVS
jgi:hypothetical protein